MERHSCFTCSGFGERLAPHVWCERNHLMVSMPETGCSNWQREPGADDEGEPPLKPVHWDTLLAQARAAQAARQ